MPSRFAPAISPCQPRVSRPIARAMGKRAMEQVANDNFERPGIAVWGSDEPLLEAALQHFAEYGLGAAPAALAQTEKACVANDMEAYEWWLGITRMLDRRLASKAERDSTFPRSDTGAHCTFHTSRTAPLTRV